MPAKDIYHASFIRALEKDGWTITHDSLTVTMPTVDKVERYRKIIEDLLTSLTECRYANADAVNETVFDREKDRYLVVTAGWEGKNRRVYFNLVHLDIINGKVWIQRDGTEEGIAYELEAAGVPKEDIVPAFHPANVRIHTGYAVA